MRYNISLKISLRSCRIFIGENSCGRFTEITRNVYRIEISSVESPTMFTVLEGTQLFYWIYFFSPVFFYFYFFFLGNPLKKPGAWAWVVHKVLNACFGEKSEIACESNSPTISKRISKDGFLCPHHQLLSRNHFSCSYHDIE